MSTIILYRAQDTSEEEVSEINKFFPSTFLRNAIPKRIGTEASWLVIGRYSVLPFYRELEKDIEVREATLINSFSEHSLISDVGRWSDILEGITPKTWPQGSFDLLPSDKSFVLKGQTNSKKFLWNTHMFAKTKTDVRDVFAKLLDDTLIGSQIIYAREYVPLVTYGTGLHGLPITKEFRFFVLFGEVLCGGYYWSSHVEEVYEANKTLPSVNEVPQKFLNKILQRIGSQIPFYAVDVAQTLSGEWLVIDLNDGQMSGLSEIHPSALYLSMYNTLLKHNLI